MSDSRALGFPEGACALALLCLPGVGPAGLGAALEQRTPTEAWRAVLDGLIKRPIPRSAAKAGSRQQTLVPPASPAVAQPRALTWQGAARRCDPAVLWRGARAQGIEVTWRGEDRYPSRLTEDAEAPPILTWRGDLQVLAKPTVAIVGTRHCTPAGRTVAYEMARDLTEAGVCVVSGLALGIDGSAHRGALAATGEGPVTAGVAASGVDVPYPRQHRELWEGVVTQGVVISETAPGRPAQAWRFPARNRIIAGLADVVVVVESFEAGGSLLTVDAALARGVEVRVVPGPVHSPASSGTNRLLMDGAGPVRHAGDVLDALGIDRSPVPSRVSAARYRSGTPGVRAVAAERGLVGGDADLGAVDPVDHRVLDAVGWAPTLLGRIVERSGCSVGAAVAALGRLEERDLVMAGASWWVRRPRD